MPKKKQKTKQVEIEDFIAAALPPAAYVYVKNGGEYSDSPPVQRFGRVSSAHAFAAALREYVEVIVVEQRDHN